MNIVIAVMCGQRKVNYACCAEELYCGSLFKAAKGWAKRHAIEWFIVSAKHGLLLPQTIVAPYDVKLGKGANALNKQQQSQWAEQTRKLIEERYGKRRIVCLCSKEYESAFSGLNCYFPLQRMGIGKRIKWLLTT